MSEMIICLDKEYAQKCGVSWSKWAVEEVVPRQVGSQPAAHLPNTKWP